MRLEQKPHFSGFSQIFAVLYIKWSPATVASYDAFSASLDSELTMLRETGLKWAPMLFMPKPIIAKSLRHQLNAPSKCPCFCQPQLTARAILLSRCGVVSVMKVTPSAN